jgi:hypothetical protein
MCNFKTQIAEIDRVLFSFAHSELKAETLAVCAGGHRVRGQQSPKSAATEDHLGVRAGARADFFDYHPPTFLIDSWQGQPDDRSRRGRIRCRTAGNSYPGRSRLRLGFKLCQIRFVEPVDRKIGKGP